MPERTASWNRREREAHDHRPKRIRLLLLAESPPSEERSFYSPGVPDDRLREIVQVLFEVRPEDDTQPFLKELRRRGVFLLELKPDAPRRGEDLEPYVGPLLINLSTLAPETIVIVDPDVYDAAYQPLRDAGFAVVDVRIPRSGGNHPEGFRQGLRQALVRSGLETLIRPLPRKKQAKDES